MASEKKQKRQKIEKSGEKLGELTGVRRPYLGALALFLAVIFTAAMVNYAPGQNVLFRESLLRDFIYSTSSAPDNLCGTIGATFCVVSISLIGAATWLMLAYLALAAALCFRRRPRLLPLGQAASMLFSIVLLSTMCAMFQMFRDGSIVSTEYFTSGWGGKLGTFLYAEIMHPALRFFGSLILLAALYSFAFIASFSGSPSALVRDLCDSLRGAPSAAMRAAAAFFGFFARIFSGKKGQAAQGDLEIDAKSEDALLSPEGTQHVRVPRSRRKTARGGEPDSGPADGETAQAAEKPAKEDDFYDGDGDFVLKPPADSALEAEGEEPEATGPAALDEVLGLSGGREAGVRPAYRPLSEVAEFGREVDEGQAKKLKISTIEQDAYVPPKHDKKRGDYVFPTIDALNLPKRREDSQSEDYEARMEQIIETLQTFGIGVTPAEAFAGPVITRYEVRLNAGIKASRIYSLEEDIALGLKVPSVRVASTGRGTIGIEVPNKVRQNVCIREILESKEWNETKAAIPVVMGKDVTGKPVVLDLAKMPHALIAGSTGSGKSVCINVIIASLLYHSTPDDLRFIMVDPKVVELQGYNSLPHMLVPVVTDPRKVPAALTWLVNEMMKRYDIFQKAGVKNIAGFNAKILKDREAQKAAAEMEAEMSPEERVAGLDAADPERTDFGDVEIPKKKLPYIVCIIDELADLMMVAGKEVETAIARLTQLARAAGIHLLVATQRPSTNVVTGLIKANLPTRIGFKVASYIDSRTILDSKGAETLIGWGDMLFIPPGSSDLIRAQGAFISDEEIASILEALKVNGEPEFEEDMQQQLEAAGEDGDLGIEGEWNDSMAPQAAKIIRESNRASVSFLQRKMRIGYNRAASIMDELEEKGLVGPDTGPGGSREIFM